MRVPYLRDLRPIFAPDIHSPKLFKQRLGQDLKAIAKVYRDFDIEIEGDLLLLRKSAPPVPKKLLI